MADNTKGASRFPDDVRVKILVDCGRCCAICHRFCGPKLELHHIVQRAEQGDDTYDNCIPLCFDCHADMRSYDHKHPKGVKYTVAELKTHKTRWFEKVANTGAVGEQPEHVDLDRSTLLRLLVLLPWNGFILFARDVDFAAGSFPRDSVDQLDEYLRQCRDPAFEFIDTDLEALRAALTHDMAVLNRLIGRTTFPSLNAGERRNAVPPEWRLTQPDHFQRAVDDLNTAAESICASYDRLVALGRRKLGVQLATVVGNGP